MVEDGGLRLRRRAAGEQQDRRVLGLLDVGRRLVGGDRPQLVEPRLGLVGLDEVAGAEALDQCLLLRRREPVVERRVRRAGPGAEREGDNADDELPRGAVIVVALVELSPHPAPVAKRMQHLRSGALTSEASF